MTSGFKMRIYTLLAITAFITSSMTKAIDPTTLLVNNSSFDEQIQKIVTHTKNSKVRYKDGRVSIFTALSLKNCSILALVTAAGLIPAATAFHNNGLSLNMHKWSGNECSTAALGGLVSVAGLAGLSYLISCANNPKAYITLSCDGIKICDKDVVPWNEISEITLHQTQNRSGVSSDRLHFFTSKQEKLADISLRTLVHTEFSIDADSFMPLEFDDFARLVESYWKNFGK